MLNQQKLLIVEDDNSIHKLIASALRGVNVQTLNAYDGAEGVHLYREHKPSIVLLDVDMPVMNGMQFLQHLDFKKNKQCPVIVMSGLASNKEQELCLALGAEMFIGKPFQIVALKKTIEYYLERSRLP